MGVRSALLVSNDNRKRNIHGHLGRTIVACIQAKSWQDSAIIDKLVSPLGQYYYRSTAQELREEHLYLNGFFWKTIGIGFT